MSVFLEGPASEGIGGEPPRRDAPSGSGTQRRPHEWNGDFMSGCKKCGLVLADGRLESLYGFFDDKMVFHTFRLPAVRPECLGRKFTSEDMENLLL